MISFIYTILTVIVVSTILFAFMKRFELWDKFINSIK